MVCFDICLGTKKVLPYERTIKQDISNAK